MLSDREREALADMERELLGKDPRLTRRFENAAYRQRRMTHRARDLRYDWVLQLLIGLTLLFSAVAILVGYLGPAVGWATVSGSLVAGRRWLRANKALPEQGAPDAPESR